jgi:hypothetical protein
MKTEFTNLSDGNSDGIVLFYMKEGMLYPVLLNKDQAEMLDITIAAPFKSKLAITPTPLEYEAIKHMIID